jgi:hypothetical protein
VVLEVVYGNLLIWRELLQDSPIHAIDADIWDGERRLAVFTPVHYAGWLPSQVHAYVQRTLNLLENEYGFPKFASQIIEQCPIRPNTVRLRKKCKIFQRENAIFRLLFEVF